MWGSTVGNMGVKLSITSFISLSTNLFQEVSKKSLVMSSFKSTLIISRNKAVPQKKKADEVEIYAA